MNRRLWAAAVCCLLAAARLGLPTQGRTEASGTAEAPFLPNTVRLYGYVSEQGGGPVADVGVDVWDDSNATLIQAGTNASGLYDVTLPYRSQYHMRFSQWTDGDPYSYHKYILPEKSVIPGGASEVRTDVTMVPVANLILELYDSEGNQVRYAAFSAISQRYFFATDDHDLPVTSAVNAAIDPYFHEHGGDFALALPTLLVAPDTRVRLHVQWTVPDVGDVIIDLDGGADGYLTPAKFGYRVLNVNQEAARSAVNRLAGELSDFTGEGYSFSTAIASGLSVAQAALAAGDAHMAHIPPEMALAVTDYGQALSEALLAQEAVYVEKAQADIPRNRKGTLTLSLRSADGQPLAGAVVTYQQRTRDFLFSGGNLSDGWSYDPEKADLMEEMGVNSAAVGASYGLLEPSPGEYDWTYIDVYSGLPSMLAKGFRVNGAVAYYAFPDSEWECPAYWRGLTFAQFKVLLFNHFKALAARYGTRMGPWMLNEQNVTDCLNQTWEQRLEVFQAVMDGLHAGDPGAQNLVTGLAMPYGWSEPMPAPGEALPFSIPFPAYLDLLLERGLPLDMIGLEFHFFGVTVYIPGEGGGSVLPGMTLAALARLMDRYDAYGVPVWIEPFQVPSRQEPGSAWWHRLWDEATQAEFATRFYTLAFSRKNMHDICWSDASDRNPFIVSAGLLNSDYTPKPAYYALKDLIASWTTSGVGTADENGELEITGFAGDYTLAIVTPGGDHYQAQVHIYEQEGRREIVVPRHKACLPLVRKAATGMASGHQ